ncbi:MAG: PASTA domain-containing protein [Chitinophagaceae bacterium]|nr:PASTA domain-containing protein [Chitinophagaceae bacterium]
MVFEFITKRPLWINVLAALVISFLVLFIFLQTLNFWTNHGDYLRIPDVKGKKIEEATNLLEKQGFEVLVQDSVFIDTLPPLAVIKQFPDPDATVKVNRTVYLTINRAEAPIIDMPNLIGMTFRNAELEMKARGLKLGDTIYVPDIAKNAVKDQLLDDVSIKPGTKITMGSVISLVLGAGIGNEDVAVPDLYGMPFGEAKVLLDANFIQLGIVELNADLRNDTAAGYIYRQNPERYNEERKINRIRPGQMMDIWLQLTKPERKIDSITRPLPSAQSDY